MRLIVIQLCAFWPVWHWYASRLADGNDEPLGLVPLATAMGFLWVNRRNARTLDSGEDGRHLGVAMLVTLFYAVAYPYLPMLICAGIAMLAAGMTLSALRLGCRLHAGLVGLLVLSLPVLASWQYYGGFPLRRLVACLACWLLNLGGLSVAVEGTGLAFAGGMVSVDAPCSGIKMLWTGMYLALALACFYELSFWRTVGVACVTLGLVIIGNAVRASALFYTEAGFYHLPGYFHQGIGASAFVMTAVLIVLTTRAIGRRCVCVPVLSVRA